MNPRRPTPSVNTLSPPDAGLSPQGSRSPGSQNFPRSVSPSNGFTQFLSKPTKWFNRSHSSGSLPGRSSTSSSEPRSSSSSGRKPKISHPTDPRPLLDQLRPEPAPGLSGLSGAGSRSVLDLSLARTTTAFETSRGTSPSLNPSSPSRTTPSRGLGDLRSISRKPWSKSADDLGKLSYSIPMLSPIDTSFHDKVESYRSNRNDSVGSRDTPTTSHSPKSTISPTFPFPTITTNAEPPLSSSPPQRAQIPASTIGSSPVSGVTPPLTPNSQQNNGHIHARSHSFTPRLPSKLSSPKLGLVPPSPKRKGSSSETDKAGLNSNIGHAPKPTFPFGFGSSSGINRSTSPLSVSTEAISPLDRPGGSSGLLAPPAILDPGGDAKGDKRTSQLIYHSGFINRFADFSPSTLNTRVNHSYMSGSGGLTLAKGWKPFKLVLKGSKLYFYKPPSDRSAAVKELFPTELVVVLEDEGLAENEIEVKDEVVKEQGDGTPRSAKGRDRDEGRRKRTFWGSTTHPSLVCAEGIERGTFEALIHEAVFGTTFHESSRELQGSEGVSDVAPRGQSQWQSFASAIMMALPSLIDRTQFESEFRRCCTMLLASSSDTDEKREMAVSKIVWLADQYITFYGVPSDGTAWEEWRSNTIPASGQGPSLPGLPQSSSMQALYTLSPQLPSTAQVPGTEMSPDLGAFSPRPGANSRMLSLLDALGNTPASKGSSVPTSNSWQILLEEGGLTRDILLRLDNQLIARSLFLFNQHALQQLPDNITFASCPLDGSEMSANIEDTSIPVSPLAPFLGSDDHPHWLTKLVLIQILISDSPTAPASQMTVNFGRNMDMNTPARTHSRSDVISAWARIGELCRRTGDDCSWRAIFAALCSRPIARLDKVWKRVDGEAMRTVQSWVYPHDGADIASVNEPKHIPWAGARVVEMQEKLDAARSHDTAEWKVAPLLEASDIFLGMRQEFSLCSKKPMIDKVDDASDLESLGRHWQSLCFQGSGNVGVASKLKRIDQFMSLSLAAEPRRKGLFEPYYWTRPPAQQAFHPLTPLLFPEPLPTMAFVNRALIHRGRLESTTSSLNIQDLQQLREGKPPPDSQKRGNSELNPGDALDLGGTIIMVYEGELMLLVQPGDVPSQTPSRPPSTVAEPQTTDKPFNRNPSVRVKPGSKGLDRKPSQLRRSSLPALSKKPSFEIADVATERPLRVVIQAGTLDRLVDILVEGLHGVSVSVADDNGEMPLNDKKMRELKVDMTEFSRVWWSTFRSFVTPHVFFELLRKRYVSAQIKSQSPSGAEVASLVRSRSEVLETINRWIHDGGGAQDALDDPHLYCSIMSFFRHPTDHSPPTGVSTANAPAIHHGFSLVNNNLKAVFTSFTAQTRRPIARTTPVLEPIAEASSDSEFGSKPPDIDKISPEELVNNLDAMAYATFRNVGQEDLFVAADIMEVQTADRTGWFPSREPNAISDEVEIQSIHTYLHDVEPSTMISELSQESLYRLLPPTIRGCIRAFTILRKWLVSKLVAFRIGLRTRHARMELILKAIEVCRLRNAEPGTTEPSVADRPCIRSFVEAVLSSAAVSMESRMYHRAWQSVASNRGTTCDSLSGLLNKITVGTPAPSDPLTVDMGWLLERTIEIISLPDLIESSIQENLALVNFEKRRSINGLLTNSPPLGLRGKTRHRTEVNRKDFERLNNIEQELTTVHFDLRVIREDAYREVTQAAMALTRRQQVRPFQALVSAQQEKNKRDRTLRDKLSREKRQEQQRQDRREEYLNKAMHTRRPALPAQKQHRNKKSVSSAFMQLMRPISSAFSSDTVSFTTKRTPAELDFMPTGKPAMVLNVADARVSRFVNNERSFTFQLDTEDGGHYLLQAIDKADMNKWMDTVERVSKMAAKRRLTYLGNNPKMQMSEHLAAAGSTSRDPRAVFGVDLEYLLERDSPDGDVPSGTIPPVILRLIEEVESRGLQEIGIYRLAGAHSEVNAFRDAMNRGEWPVERYTDINTVCDLIKSWFRVLPGGMFPAPLHIKVMDAAGPGEVDLDTKLSNIRRVIQDLPRARYDLLKRLMEHLDKVTDFEENNQMTAESLATVFSPNLLRAPDDDVGFFFANMGAAHRATKILITHAHAVFNDVEPDLDVDHDEEEYEHFDEPIPEEDEEDEELLSAAHEQSDEEEAGSQIAVVISHAPVLDFTLPSPCDLTIPMPP